MSADQALTRAQERKNSKIDAAIAAGKMAQLQKSMNVTLKLTSGGSMRLVSADGTVSPEGRHYYSKLGVEPPSIFPYEQGLEAGKWIRAFDGKKKMVGHMELSTRACCCMVTKREFSGCFLQSTLILSTG